ncbi:MAG: 12-oxophytodienoate reductase [Novosphingobium sp.]|nr:12-oxophytodienoate reductase [Novosphingobium sp.]
MIDIEPLFAPIALGGTILPNRFVLPGMQRGWCSDGAPTHLLTEYYRRRIAGGVGLIVSESVAIDHPSATQSDSFARLDDRTAGGWGKCISAVRQEGGKIFLQLWHEGGVRTEGGSGPLSHHPTLSPSGLAAATRPNGRAATIEEIAAIRQAFVQGAVLAQEAGADGVEVHAAHGYLLDQFLWAATNRRKDEYGGSDIRNRVRLPAEIVAGIRAACGPDFPISLRFSQWKEADYAARVVDTPAELETMLAILKAAGVSAIHASTRRFWEPEWSESPLSLAGWCKRLSDIPVITVGSVGLDTDVMESFQGKEPRAQVRKGVTELLRRFSGGEFDMVSVGRSQIADPEWVSKVHRLEFDRIRPFKRSDMRMSDSDVAAEARRF